MSSFDLGEPNQRNQQFFQVSQLDHKKVERRDAEEKEDKTFVTYGVEIGSRSFNVTVGFSEERLQQYYAGEISDEQGLLDVIDKIVHRMCVEDLILLTGKSISTNLANAEDTKIHDLSTKEVKSLEEIRRVKGNKELVKTIDRVVSTFQNSEIGKLVGNSIEGNHRESLGDDRVSAGLRKELREQAKVKEVSEKSIYKGEETGLEVEIEIENAVEKIEQKGKQAERIAANNKDKENRFKNIEKKWTHSDGENEYSITEKINRIDTSDRMKEIANAELDYLKKFDPNGSNAEVTARKKLLNEMLKEDDNDTSWAGSDHFRDMLRGKKELNSRKLGRDGIKSAVDSYAKIMDEQYYARPLPINMRYHSCGVYSQELDIGDTEGWLRAGVISCLDNGFVNQTSMKELSEALNKEPIDINEVNKIRSVMADEIIKVWKKNFNKSNKIDATAGYALTQLGYTPEEVQEIGRNRNYKLSLEIGDENVGRVKTEVNEIFKKRDDLLASQFLQLVMEQIEHSDPEELKNGLQMIHVGLLNHKSKSVDKGTGWYHSEENEMKDMAAIMDEFNSKTIIFGEGGPFIDRDGKIHLPKPDDYEGKDEITLNSVFINISVQGNNKNNGAQLEINQSALEKIQLFDKDLAADLADDIGKEGAVSDYAIAAKVINKIRKKPSKKVSTGCLSAKDRTGGVSLLLTDHIMDDLDCPKVMRAKVRREQLVSPDSPAVRVVRDCTKTKAMKISVSGYGAVIGEQKLIDKIGVVISMLASTVWEAGVMEPLRIQKKEL